MGKVAPLWLAVVFGGGCFVAGGTYGIVKVGDYCLDSFEVWQERQQLRLQSGEEPEVEKEGEPTSDDGGIGIAVPPSPVEATEG